MDSGSLRRALWRLVARNAQGFLVCGNHDRCIPIHSVKHLSVRNHTANQQINVVTARKL